MRVFVSAGEPSGDHHAALLVRAIRERRPDVEFAGLGGHALEVSLGGIARHDMDRLATLTRRSRLAASTGSDFHDPSVPWNSPGRFAKLPADLEPVAACL